MEYKQILQLAQSLREITTESNTDAIQNFFTGMTQGYSVGRQHVQSLLNKIIDVTDDAAIVDISETLLEACTGNDIGGSNSGATELCTDLRYEYSLLKFENQN